MVVRMRSTKARRNNRRSKQGLSLPTLHNEGGISRIRHRVSKVTGIYKGKQVVDIKKKQARQETKKAKKLKKEEISENVKELPSIEDKK